MISQQVWDIIFIILKYSIIGLCANGIIVLTFSADVVSALLIVLTIAAQSVGYTIAKNRFQSKKDLDKKARIGYNIHDKGKE